MKERIQYIVPLKSIRYLSLILLINSCFLSNLTGQGKGSGIGFELGIGNISYDGWSAELISPFSFNDTQLGVYYFFNPKKTPFISLKAGLMYNSNISERKLSFLRIYTGCEFNIGKKNKFIFGLGQYTSYLASGPIKAPIYLLENTYRDYTYGFAGNIGYSLYINPIIRIKLCYQAYFGQTTLREIPWSSPGGFYYTVECKEYSGFLNCCLIYIFPGTN